MNGFHLNNSYTFRYFVLTKLYPQYEFFPQKLNKVAVVSFGFSNNYKLNGIACYVIQIQII
jgi:hypothetical protein